MLKTITTIIGVFFGTFFYAQNLTPEMLGFEQHTLQFNKTDTVNYYLSINSDSVKKPLLVYLDGSGANPLFQELNAGIGSTVVLDFQQLSAEYSILLISKPGIPFVAKVDEDENGFPHYPEPEEYTSKLSLDWRVQSAHQVINSLITKDKIDASKIVVLGFSEGAQVGPQLAVLNGNISHLLLFGGNGLNQFIDPIITLRMQASRGEKSEIQAQAEIDSLFQEYARIYEDPDNTKKKWWGHTYKRWASFTQHDPYKYLLELDIPIYISNGSLDENSVLSADYIKLEFIKNKKDNLTYKTYPNCDHQFNEIIIENGTFVEAIPKLELVMKAAFEWLNTH